MKRKVVEIPGIYYQKINGYSISSILGELTEPFDREGVAVRTHNNNYNDASSKYYQMTVEQILEQWDANAQRSIMLGCCADDYVGYKLAPSEMKIPYDTWLENHNFNSDTELQNHCLAAQKFIDAQTDKDYMYFIGREIPMAYYFEENNIKYQVRGRLDNLFYNQRINKYVIVDYKTADDITLETTKWTDKMLGPAKCYPALKMFKFTFQLHFYRLSLSQMLNIPLSDIVACIVQLRSDGEYVVWKEAFELNNETQHFDLGVWKWAIRQIDAHKNVAAIIKDTKDENELF